MVMYILLQPWNLTDYFGNDFFFFLFFFFGIFVLPEAVALTLTFFFFFFLGIQTEFYHNF